MGAEFIVEANRSIKNSIISRQMIKWHFISNKMRLPEKEVIMRYPRHFTFRTDISVKDIDI